MEMNENLSPDYQSKTGGKSQIREEPPRHYYGDVTRRLFIAGGIIVLVGMPFFADYLKQMVALSALGVIAIALIAGFANPRSRNVQILLLLVSSAAVLFFESYAAYLYSTVPLEGRGLLFVAATQILAIIFFLALYFSAKTVRGMSPRAR